MSKSKWSKAVLVAAVATLMAPAAASLALADPLPPASGDLVIHKYIGDPIADAERNGTQIDTSTWTSVTPVNGVAFDLYKVGGPVRTPAAPDDGWPAEPAMGSYVLNNAVSRLEVYNGTTLIGQYTVTPAATPSVTTGPNGAGTATALPQGLYLVRENVSDSTHITNASTGEEMFISQAAVPFLVSVPMTAPDGKGWLDVVHVYPKNEALHVEKAVNTAGAVAVGDTVSYTISTSVPAEIADYKKFDVYDVLHPALDYVMGSVTVATLPELTGPDALVDGLDYDTMYDPVSRTVAVMSTDHGRVKLAQVSTVVVTLDTTVNASILDGLTVENTAVVELTNHDGTDFEGKSTGGGTDPTIHTAAIEITKVDQTGAALNGATFAIASSEANAKAGNFLRLDPGTHILHDVNDPMWATLGAGNDYVIKPANVASFVGLRDTVDVNGTPVWQTYWVVETAAPASYNALTAPIEVSFESAFHTVSQGTEFDHIAKATVQNLKGFILPETGGAGTILWTVAGIVLIGVAVLVVATKRSKQAVTQ